LSVRINVPVTGNWSCSVAGIVGGDWLDDLLGGCFGDDNILSIASVRVAWWTGNLHVELVVGPFVPVIAESVVVGGLALSTSAVLVALTSTITSEPSADQIPTAPRHC